MLGAVLYDMLDAQAVQYIVEKDKQLQFIVVQYIVEKDQHEAVADADVGKAKELGVELLGLSALLAKHGDSTETVEPKPSDLASGTTGDPNWTQGRDADALVLRVLRGTATKHNGGRASVVPAAGELVRVGDHDGVVAAAGGQVAFWRTGRRCVRRQCSACRASTTR